MWTGKIVNAVNLLLIVVLGMLFMAGCSSRQTPDEQSSALKPTKEQLVKLEQLNQTADNMYKKVMQGDLSGGRAILQQLSEQIPQIRYEGITTLEGLHALTDTITVGKRVFNSVKLSQEESQTAVAAIRLATDALTHSNEPMWMQYYNSLQDDLNDMEQSMHAKKKSELVVAVSEFRQHIHIIHPSLLINRDPIEVEKLDSFIMFITEQIQSEQEQYRQILNVMPSLRHTIDVLFLKKEAIAYLPVIDEYNPMMWTFVLSSIILSILGFAAWRLARKNDGVITIRRQV